MYIYLIFSALWGGYYKPWIVIYQYSIVHTYKGQLHYRKEIKEKKMWDLESREKSPLFLGDSGGQTQPLFRHLCKLWLLRCLSERLFCNCGSQILHYFSLLWASSSHSWGPDAVESQICLWVLTVPSGQHIRWKTCEAISLVLPLQPSYLDLHSCTFSKFYTPTPSLS